MTVAEEFQKDVAGSIQSAVDAANTKEARERVKTVLTNWLMLTARKKPLSDLPKRLEDFTKRIEALASNVQAFYFDGRIVIKATGDSESTFRMLNRGTDWFEPVDNLNNLIAGAIFAEA